MDLLYGREKRPVVTPKVRKEVFLGVDVQPVPEKVGSTSSSCITRTKSQRLWQRILQRASLICPTSLLLRRESPNFPDRGEGWISTADVGGCTATVLQPGCYKPVHDGQSNSTKWSETA